MTEACDSKCVRRPWRRAAAERLEPRRLLSFGPVGPEIRVDDAYQYPSAAMDADGDFVIAWSGSAPGGENVYAQRYDAQGAAAGPEIRVNTTTAGEEMYAEAAMDDDGDFVVTWTSRRSGSGYGVYAQRYNAQGQAQGGEFRVNTYTNGAASFQRQSHVAMDADGDFVVVWNSNGQDGSGVGIYAQRYDAQGVAQGGEFRVNTHTAGDQYFATAAMDSDGDFVVSWSSAGQDGSGYGIYAQRYDAQGAAAGGEFRVNTTTASDQRWPAAAMDEDGDILVSWSGWDGDLYGVYAQRYNAQGVAQGAEFRVNTFTAKNQLVSTVAMDADGDFVVSWTSRHQDYEDVDDNGVYGQRYDAHGVPQGAEFRVPTTITGDQDSPSAAMEANGDFVVAWASQDGVRAQVYSATGPTAVVGRQVFYNRSRFDGNDPGANAADDGAVASGKEALRPGQQASFSNITSYARGINGVMFDVAHLPQGAVLTADDFDFGDAGQPASVTVRRGDGMTGSDRVTLTWPDYNPLAAPGTTAVGNGWLTVTVKANADTGLSQPDVFSFGNLIGETGEGDGVSGWRVSALDLSAVKREANTNSAPRGRYDFNRDGRVNALDLAAVRANLNRRLAAPGSVAAGHASLFQDRAMWDEVVATMLL